MKNIFRASIMLVLVSALNAFAFGSGGCGEGACADCHSLSKDQVSTIFSGLGASMKVQNVAMSKVPGLWEVVVERNDGVKFPVFLDFSLKYIIQGEALEISSKENITKNSMVELNKIDPSKIPLDDAVVIGDPKAPKRIIVFDDPECPYCKKVHASMKEVVAKNKDYAFFIKMLPLDIHPNAAEKARAIVCKKSLELLDKSLNGEEIEKPSCKTDQIEKNKELAKELKIVSTPSLIYPDGRVYPGFRPPEKIVEAMEKDATLNKNGSK